MLRGGRWGEDGANGDTDGELLGCTARASRGSGEEGGDGAKFAQVFALEGC